jgi:hypothetical protein
LGAWVAQWVRSHFFHDELYNLYKYSLSKICYNKDEGHGLMDSEYSRCHC